MSCFNTSNDETRGSFEPVTQEVALRQSLLMKGCLAHQKLPPPVGLCLGPYSGPRKGGSFNAIAQEVALRPYLTSSVYEFVLQKSIPTKICQIVL